MAALSLPHVELTFSGHRILDSHLQRSQAHRLGKYRPSSPVHLCDYETHEDVIERLPFFIEQVCNRKRLHSSIGYVPPIEFEAAIPNMKPADRPVLNL